MTRRQFYDWQTAGGAGDVATLVRILEEQAVPWCMIGGLAVNHWADEPMATADVAIVVATEQFDACVAALGAAGFTPTAHAWSVNLKGGSNVSIQISTEEFYRDYPGRSVPADVHGILMRVAALEDTLKGKLKAWAEPAGRASKRQKDLTDIFRLVEAHPHLRGLLPEAILARLDE